jgi:hypothetical protein
MRNIDFSICLVLCNPFKIIINPIYPQIPHRKQKIIIISLNPKFLSVINKYKNNRVMLNKYVAGTIPLINNMYRIFFFKLWATTSIKTKVCVIGWTSPDNTTFCLSLLIS